MWRRVVGQFLRMVMISMAALFLVACGALPHSPQKSPHTPPTFSPMSIGPVLQFTTVSPRLVMYHHIPRALVVDSSLNQLVLYRRGATQWHAQVLMKASLSQLFGADTLICQATGCLAAAELGGTGATDRIVVFFHRSGSRGWTTVWKTTVPRIAAGATLQLAADGHDAWLLSTGSPSAGLMPKLLWVSPTNGQTWHLVATGNLPAIKAPFTIPQGYPTGIVATAPGQLLLSMSPRGNNSTLAIQYTAQPLAQNPFTFPISSVLKPFSESLPAIVGSAGVSLPLIDQQGYLAIATSSSGSLPGSVHQTHVLTDGSPMAVSGSDTAMISNIKTIQLLSPDGRVVTLPILHKFIKPLVMAIIGPQSVAVMGKHGTLWTNTRTGSWYRFDD